MSEYNPYELDVANMRQAGVSEKRIQEFMKRRAMFQQHAEYMDQLHSSHKHTAPIRELMRKVGRLKDR